MLRKFIVGYISRFEFSNSPSYFSFSQGVIPGRWCFGTFPPTPQTFLLAMAVATAPGTSIGSMPRLRTFGAMSIDIGPGNFVGPSVAWFMTGD